MKKLAGLIFGLILLLIGFCIPVVVLEIALRMGYRYDDLNWTPPEAILVDGKYSEDHANVSKAHPYGFNDTTISSVKPPGVFRIAILGDSVIWGDGLPDEERWSRKFEKLVKGDNPNIQVLHWGICGWSTLDQVKFLKAHAAEWALDYLLIGYISNDPDVKTIPQNHFQWNTYRFPREMAKVFPYAARFIFGYLSQLLNERVPGWGYDYWEEQLYTDANLKEYEKVVRDLKSIVTDLQVPTTVLLIPSSWYSYFGEKFQRVTPIFERAAIPVFNMYPEIYSRLSNVPLPDLRANRADGHPGPLMTDAFADIVHSELWNLYKDAGGVNKP